LSERPRYAALRGKIAPSARHRFGSGDFDGTVGRKVHGSAEEATDLAELDPASQAGGEHELASEVSERIRAIISSAEAAAGAVRHEAEQRAQVKRRLAEDEARRIVEDARRDAEAFLAERIRRISELSDDVVERGEGIVMRLDRAEEVRRQLQGLADALGESAEELARELGTEPGTGASPRTGTTKPPPLRPPTEPPLRGETGTAAAEAAAGEPAPVEEIAEDPTLGELAGEVAEAEAKAEAAEAEEEVPVVPVELVPEEPQDAPQPARPGEPDEQLSARLVALQMAVAGGKRSEVKAHLERTFDLGDVTKILDDVFGDDGGDEKAGWPTTRGGAA
jgi:hypothetical protein